MIAEPPSRNASDVYAAKLKAISDHEVRLIREQWEKDQTQDVLWEVNA